MTPDNGEEGATPQRMDAWIVYRAGEEALGIVPNPVAISFVLARTEAEAVAVHQVPGVYARLASESPTEDVLRVSTVAIAGVLGSMLMMFKSMQAAMEGAAGAGMVDPRRMRARGQ